ncbi:MAG: cellulase family glycosylhydrolase [Pseudomonadota bacterium]
MAATPGFVSHEIDAVWNEGFVASVSFTPQETVNGWQVELFFDGEITNIWDATIVSRDGDRYLLANSVYNGAVAGGQSVGFGFQAEGSADDLFFTSEEPVPAVIPEVSVDDVAKDEGDEEVVQTPSLFGPLTTSGATIVNEDGETVQIRAVNWFGMETETFAPHGLWSRNWQEMMDEIKATGFNAIRLPFSLQAILDGDAVPNGIDLGANPDLQNLSAIQILDKIVAYAEEIEVGIILDNHRSAAGPGPNGNGLWFDGGYSEDDWIEVWELLAARYGDSPAIIGADLVNEPHGAQWNDWAAAAERAGNAVLEFAPDWLIVVEGVGGYNGDNYWWGGSLKGVADRPVVLSTPNKLVYSPHDYPASVFAQPWFFDGSDLYEVFRENWGFIHEEAIAPIFLGEFGSKLETDVDQAWADAIVKYLGGDFDGDGTVEPGAEAMHFAWWSWNPNSGDTGGILQDDWRTPRENALELLEPLLDETGGGTRNMVFEINLSEPVNTETVVDFATADGTATAGEDYLAKEGSLVFAPGETYKTVSVAILGDTIGEGDETFTLNLEGPGGSTQATGTILGDDGGPPLPIVSTPNIKVREDDSFAFMNFALSEASDEKVKIVYRLRGHTAEDGEDFIGGRGKVVFRPGETEQSAAFEILDDALVEGTEIVRVILKVVTGATLERKVALVRIIDDDKGSASFAPLDEPYKKGDEAHKKGKGGGRNDDRSPYAYDESGDSLDMTALLGNDLDGAFA